MGTGGRPKVALGLLRRAVSKKLTGRMKYRSGTGYDAQRYWTDRFDKYGASLRGAGHEGLPEDANEKMYTEAAGIFESVVGSLEVDLTRARALEVGCGTGFYTARLHGLGVESYTGVDITSTLFDTHRHRFPNYRFVQGDVTRDPIAGEFDLAVMIDVTEHIVARDALEAAFANVGRALAPGGYFIVGPQFERSRRHLFYVHFWSVEDVKSMLRDWAEVAQREFRNGTLLVFQKPL